MKNQRVLNTEQINWFNENSTRLNYHLLFDEDPHENTTPDTLADSAMQQFEHSEALQSDVMHERDQKWKIKVKKTRETAFAEGFEAGKKQGMEEARTELEEKLQFINSTLEAGRTAWKHRQEMLDPGLLDLAFDIAEAILGIPIDQSEIRKSLELSLGPILERTDEQSKPVLLVAENDFEYIQQLKADYAPKTFLKIRVDASCKPGEFRFESTDEVVIYNCKNALREFRKSLSVPTWHK